MPGSFYTQDDFWEPADICVEAVGYQTRTINDCLYLVKRCGKVLALGVPDEPIYPFDFNRFFRRNLPDRISHSAVGDICDAGCQFDPLVSR